MSNSPDEKRDAAAVRRRWVTLGEILAVAAVLISAGSLWNSYQERKSAEAERAAAERKVSRAEAVLVLRARSVDDGKRLAIEASDPDQAIQGQRVMFPSKLGLGAIETAGDPRIEARWIASALKKRDAQRSSAGDLRVPVAIVTRFITNGVVHSDAAVYQLSYTREGHLLGGASIRLRALSLVDRIPAARAQAAVDRLWPGKRD